MPYNSCIDYIETHRHLTPQSAFTSCICLLFFSFHNNSISSIDREQHKKKMLQQKSEKDYNLLLEQGSLSPLILCSLLSAWFIKFPEMTLYVVSINEIVITRSHHVALVTA